MSEDKKRLHYSWPEVGVSSKRS